MLPLRTRIYIDGFNLYYSALKGTSYKWLDLLTLFEKHVLPGALPPDYSDRRIELDEVAIKFFTAKILERAAKATDSVSSQAHYHNALKAHCAGRIEIIEGYYAINKAKVKVVDPTDPKRWPRDCEEVVCWKLEEKQSDVNLALQLFHDALTGEIEHVVVMTNDTDLAPALSMVRTHTKAVVGLVVPSRDGSRDPNADLAKHAHWVRRSLNDAELQASELPRVIQGKRRATTKPVSWYPRPDLLEPALEAATRVLGAKNKAFKWLSKPNERLDGLVPLDLLSTDCGAERVMSYIRDYVESQP